MEDNIEDASDDCKKMLEEYIEDQDADIHMDYIIMKSCEPTMKKYCDVSASIMWNWVVNAVHYHQYNTIYT